MSDADNDTELVFDNEPIGFTDDGEEGFAERQPYEADDGKPERAPDKHTPRASVASLVTLAWGGVGTALVQSQADPPVGRVLQLQAPLAGVRFDELIAHTWLDSILQPLAKQGDKLEGLGALILFPLLVGAAERNPAAMPVIEPILRQVIRSTLVDMAPMLRKQKADDKKAAKAVAEMNEALDLDADTDPITAILESLFAPPAGFEDAEPE